MQRFALLMMVLLLMAMVFYCYVTYQAGIPSGDFENGFDAVKMWFFK